MPNNRLEYLTENDWILISARAERRRYAPGKEIIQEGARGEAVYIIRKGVASVVLGGAGGKAPVAQLGPGEICGDMAFLEKGKATASVIADEEVEVDAIRAAELEGLFASFPGLASRFYRSLAVVLARRLRVTSAQLGSELRREGGSVSPPAAAEPPRQR
jgi:CRP-like cAMP-binding protein